MAMCGTVTHRSSDIILLSNSVFSWCGDGVRHSSCPDYYNDLLLVCFVYSFIHVVTFFSHIFKSFYHAESFLEVGGEESPDFLIEILAIPEMTEKGQMYGEGS